LMPAGMSFVNQACDMMPGMVMRCPGSFTSMRLHRTKGQRQAGSELAQLGHAAAGGSE
jgi:hypothetical protein